jgi:S-adenosylmethionine uptake transporter
LGRQLAQATTPMEIAFYQNLFVTLVLAVAAPWLLILPSADHAPQIVGAAALASVSILLLSWAYARAETQKLVPLEYSAFLWTALLGWLVFAEALTLSTVAGAALIVTACLIAAPRKRTEQSVV